MLGHLIHLADRGGDFGDGIGLLLAGRRDAVDEVGILPHAIEHDRQLAAGIRD